jgi:hypothetical protein
MALRERCTGSTVRKKGFRMRSCAVRLRGSSDQLGLQHHDDEEEQPADNGLPVRRKAYPAPAVLEIQNVKDEPEQEHAGERRSDGAVAAREGVPPTTTAAMANSSQPTPSMGWPAPNCAARITPAIPDRVPLAT